MKLNHIRIESMYDSYDNDIIQSLRFLLILIPSNQLAGPRSVNEYLFFNSSL